jgi:2-polyprenyl-3-methyl-5-hydroxy-6-metoxy-1,4-benzoquinol methylase
MMNQRERLTKCPLCKSGLFLNLHEITDYAISKEKFLLCQCSKCDLIFTNPRPQQVFIQDYYESEDYISHQNKTNNLTNLLYKLVRIFTIRQKVAWLNSFNVAKGNLLDIGCGTGYFLKAAKKSGWKVTGIEPNKTARKTAKEKGLKVITDLDKINDKKLYHCISLFHVLEHVHELRKTIKKLIHLLEENGTIMIAVPNHRSLDAQHYKEHWAAWDVPRHLYHFNHKSMAYLANEFKLHIDQILPMKFDSYYVSLLSEKYQNPDQSFLKQLQNGFINGMKSNKWAKNHNNNYSSLLFILKKS